MTTIEPGVVERLQGLLEKATLGKPWRLDVIGGDHPSVKIEEAETYATVAYKYDPKPHETEWFRLAVEAVNALPSLLALLAQQQARIASQQQQIDAFSLLAGDEFAESVHSALDEAGAPRRSSDGSVIYGVVARINRLATKEPT